MKHAIQTKRKVDALIVIKQDNIARKITIKNMNKAAEILTGYSAAEIVGKDFSTILSPRINDLLNDYIEFSGSESDFAVVAGKIPNFQILSKVRGVVNVGLKVFNLVFTNADSNEYELLIRDLTLIKNIAELKERVKSGGENIETKDPQVGLPSIDSIVYAVDVSYFFMNQHSGIEISMALFEITNIGYYKETYGEYAAYEIIGNLGRMIKKCCREEDVIGYMGDGIIGIALLDCNAQDAKIVLRRVINRVNTSKIIMQNGKQVSLSLAVSFTQMRKDREITKMINDCESGLNKIAAEGGEGLVQV